MDNYFKNQRIRRLVYKTYFTNSDFSYLTKEYLNIYQVFLNNDIIFYDNSFLRIFLQYYKYKDTYLHHHLKLLNLDFNMLMSDFIKEVTEIKKLDMLLENQNNLDEIETIYEDIFYNLDNGYSVQEEEKIIHKNVYDGLIKNPKLDKNELIEIINNTFNKTAEYINNFNIPDLYNKLTVNKASDKCYTDQSSIKLYKEDLVDAINNAKELIISSFNNRHSYSQIQNKHFLDFLLYENYEIFEDSKISTFLYATSCTAYSFNLLFKCFCNKSNRKKLRTIQKKVYSESLRIQVLLDVFNSTRQDLSYFAEILMTCLLGLDENEAYQYVKNILNKDIKRIEFDKNFKKFREIFSLRSRVDEHFTNFKIESLEKIKEINKDIAQNTEINEDKESLDEFLIFQDFGFFLNYYLTNNEKDLTEIFFNQFKDNPLSKTFNIFIDISPEDYKNIAFYMNYKNYYSEILPQLIDSFIKTKTF